MSASIPSFSPSEPSTFARRKAREVIGGTILAVLGAILLVVALAIVAAWVMDVRGFVSDPADQAVIARLVPVIPFVGLAAIVHLVTAGGLVLAQRRARTVGLLVALTGAAVTVLALIAIASGNDPFAAASTVSPSVARSEGFGILGVVLALYAAAAILLSPPAREA